MAEPMELGSNSAFITGASRGVGLRTAEVFARRGLNVAVGYVSDEGAAQEVVGSLQAINPEGDFIAIGADITKPDERQAIAEQLQRWQPAESSLGHLVLNASGGLEGKRLRENPNYPYTMNVEAQVEMAQLFSSSGLLVATSTIAFPTSHQAWYLGQTLPDEEGAERPIGAWEALSGEYGIVAETKKQGVDAMIALQSELDVRMFVGSTDFIPNSDVAVLAASGKRYIPGNSDAPGLSKAERKQIGASRVARERQAELRALGLDDTLYMSEHFAGAIVGKALDPEWTGVDFVLLPDHLNEMAT